jgi:hypothetical protein
LPRDQATIQDDLDPESREVDVPGLDQQIQKPDATFIRNVQDTGIQELENADAHVHIASVAEPSEQAEPFFVV